MGLPITINVQAIKGLDMLLFGQDDSEYEKNINITLFYGILF